MLSTIVTSLVTLITLVLTAITVAVQLAMAQFSPRIVGALLRDRWSQPTHGLFAATLVYASLATPQIDDVAAGGDGYMPGPTMLIAYLLMLVSIVALVLYVHHAGQTLRVAGLIDLVGDHLHEEPAEEVDALDIVHRHGVERTRVPPRCITVTSISRCRAWMSLMWLPVSVSPLR
ncbi:DUF2254 family protein [Nocardioides exalbidus]|uniref:DUF2254 family protein n=1 Tax=Nocardioides exalbidus TaxID=402596 RepID=UPI00267B557E